MGNGTVLLMPRLLSVQLNHFLGGNKSKPAQHRHFTVSECEVWKQSSKKRHACDYNVGYLPSVIIMLLAHSCVEYQTHGVPGIKAHVV